MQLNYRDSKPIYEQIKEGIRRMIVMNVIKQDEKLPSVRVLACKYAINPNTIAKAYRELEAIFILKVVKEPLLLMLRQPGRV